MIAGSVLSCSAGSHERDVECRNIATEQAARGGHGGDRNQLGRDGHVADADVLQRHDASLRHRRAR